MYRVVPATDDTLMIVHFLPVFCIFSLKIFTYLCVKATSVKQLMLIRLMMVSTDKLRCVSIISTPALFTTIERSYFFNSGKKSAQFYFYPYFIRSATMYYTCIDGNCVLSSDWAFLSLDYVLAIKRMLIPYFASSVAIYLPIPLLYETNLQMSR